MAKPDGRIEKGQRLSTAISARAWNRAQDAADIVLGARPGFAAVGPRSPVTYLAADVLLDAHQMSFPHAGVAIELKFRQGFVNPAAASGWPDSTRNINAEFLLGVIAPMNVVSFNSAASANPRAVAITVEPLALGQRVVRCAIAGVATAYVRVLNGNHTYAQVRQMRYSGEPAELGLLESSLSGLIRICNGGVSLPTPGSIYPLPVLL